MTNSLSVGFIAMTSLLFCCSGSAWIPSSSQAKGRIRAEVESGLYLSSPQPTSTPSAAVAATVSLASILASQKAIIDGAEYQTIQASLGRSLANDAATWTVVVGETEDKKRVVGILQPGSETIYADTMAEIGSVSPSQAISTMIHAATHVHACLPSADASLYKKQNWHVVIVGGGQMAQIANKALSECLGVKTTIVTTQNGIPNRMEPAAGELELGFSQVIGNFDVLLDTVGDEFCDQRSCVVRLLQERHGCDRYLSTNTRGQEIVADKGVLFGPNEVKQYLSAATQRSNLPEFVPPTGLGVTVEKMLKQQIVIKFPDNNPGIVYLRGWDLKTYWEATTWPRDSSGTATIRFGFPVPEELDGVEERFMINDPPARDGAVDVNAKGTNEKEEEASPFLTSVVGIAGLQSQIVEPRSDCLLFLSAPFCRTCRYLSPQYLRMARLGQNSEVLYAKANATGAIGKELGRALGVDSVPTFILFRDGKVFGKPLSISRLPSKKLQAALEMLEGGLPWDEEKIKAADKNTDKKAGKD